MRPAFFVLNVMFAALTWACWRAGLLAVFPTLGWRELAMLAAVTAYAGFGLALGFLGKWASVRHVANRLPMWALGCTGLGMMLAAGQLHSVSPDVLVMVFQGLAFAIAPNILGVVSSAWLSELLWWCGGEET